MIEYRFTLQKYKRGSKLTCPKCGRKPSDYFKDNPIALEERKPWRSQTTTVQPKPIDYIDRSIMYRSHANYELNPLFIFLSGVFGEKETSRLFKLYKVGTSKKWGGSTVFWQIDRQERVRAGKIMLYNPETGHRVKEPRSYVSWVHTELRLEYFNMKQCLFGEHLLADYPTKAVAIVESEKSALVASHFMPDFIWLASGGIHGCFKADTVGVLKNRAVILCPDLGAKVVWMEKAQLLSSICSKVVFSEVLERCATGEQKGKGLDIADFLLMNDTPIMALQKMIKRCPSLQMLIDQFQLELVDR